MHTSIRRALRALPDPFPFSFPIRFAAGVIAALWLAGCSEGDPLEAARQQQATGNFQASIELLREVLAERPDDAEANFLYGRALIAVQQPTQATWALRRAMQDPDYEVAAGSQLAFAALGTEDFNVAVETATRVLEREPENALALLIRAQAQAYWRKEPEKALEDVDRLLELDPDRLEAYEPRIIALIALERFEEAHAELDAVGERLEFAEVPERVRAWHCATTAIFLQDAQEPEKAREKWTECLEAHPTHPEVVPKAVQFYDAQQDLERSMEVLRAALDLQPEQMTYRAMLAHHLRAVGRPAEAEALLREEANIEDPVRAVAAWLELARLRKALQEYGPAAEAVSRALERARELGPPTPALQFEYADTLLVAGRLEQALEVSEELIPAQRALIQARVAQERRQPRRALASFDEALRLWPNNPWARYYAARAAEDIGDFDRALEEYRYSIRIDAAATDARRRGALLLMALGEPLQALEILRTNAHRQPLEVPGQLLALRLGALLGEERGMRMGLNQIQQSGVPWLARALAAAAEGVAEREDAAAAVELIRSARGFDFTDPLNIAALHALIRFANEAGEPEAAAQPVEAAVTAHPEIAAFQVLRAWHLELSGSPSDAVRAGYQRALELQPANPMALTGMGRIQRKTDPAKAVELFDRAASLDPTTPEPRLLAADTLAATGELEEATRRLDELLYEHPFHTEAALKSARFDLARGVATDKTLERTLRAVRFGGGPEALELLSEVHAKRDEPAAAARAAERARDLRAQVSTEG